MTTTTEPAIALLHWGNVWEDFLDSIGVSFEAFCKEMTGGWMFGYIDAVQLAGVRTVLFCISTGDIHGLRRIYLAILKDIAPYLATPLTGLARELRREGCQAILCQEYEYPRFDACVLLGQLMRLPVFATFQGGNWQMSRLEKPLRPLALWAGAGSIIATQAEVERVRNKYGVPAAKLARIFNPLDLAMWEPIDRNEARAALGIPLDARVVVYHGRIELQRKGLDVLVDAWLQVCSDRPGRDLRLLIVGMSSDADKLRQLIAAKQLRGVLWVDEYILDKAIVRRYLCAADVYTLPSRHEGFPVAPLEAMACGLPVVAADAPGVADIFEKGEASGGVVVPRADATALAIALGRVLDIDILTGL